MSFRGGRGAPRGGFGGRGGEMGKFLHACEGEMVCESINPKVPQFNAQMFLENKVSIPPACQRAWLVSYMQASTD
ncbi:H/ACA ribonucleoprotein complex subunit GAR1 like [Verticillium longisporum]|uniref:H/ACA ribonucleoprotein complex subunit n=1 Tax=Verticillium longisporum TaxID=100787 RepID=A0A8I3ARQ8_VERLO|nr:H/ACA ribonucleoprotein complex subunit GAR1 like [Verticillium longisporum]